MSELTTDPDIAREDAIDEAIDHMDHYRAYRHSRIGAFESALREAGYVVVPIEEEATSLGQRGRRKKETNRG